MTSPSFWPYPSTSALLGTQSKHSRSHSTNPPSIRQSVSRSGSSPQFPSMATVVNGSATPKSQYSPDQDMTTFRDPRSPGDEFPSPRSARTREPSPHPDLNMEVATLSNKLISAINHQTHLDDALTSMRQELEAAQEKALRLDALNREHNMLVQNGDLVRKAELDALRAQLAGERKQRQLVEKEKKGIEAELESLSAALFEEANQMVATARKETEASEKRNDQLKQQVRDTESLLETHQEQLSQLKSVMAEMRNGDGEGSTAPSTPAMATHPGKRTSRELADSTVTLDGSSPAPPTSFTHLIVPVLRTDLQVFEDFKTLIDISRKSAPSSRVNSGSYAGIQIPGLSGQLGTTSNGSQTSLATPSNSSQTASAQQHNVQSLASPLIPLKELKFYKRALTEDIEPTLRLDTAPGLSWMTRRSVIASMSEGTIVVEPMPTSNKMSVFACALCGEARKSAEFARTHRFRTNESDTAQRYPLCGYCLNRVRACCDYLGFLRMVKDGHFKTDGKDGEKAAWEESVRLRESMFWSRIGGGVVPVSGSQYSPRPSTEAAPQINYSNTTEASVSADRDAPPLPPIPADVTKLGTDTMRTRSQSRPPKIIDPQDNWEMAKKSGMFDDAAPPDSGRSLASSLSPSPSPSKESLNKQSLRESLRIRPRSRGHSYEIDRITPSSDTSADRSRRTSPAPTSISEDSSGLQIHVPGGFV